MKKLIVLVCIVLMSAGSPAWTFLGAPTAELEPSQWSVGYNFGFGQADAEEADTGGNVDGIFKRHYLNLGYGLSETFEMNLLLGTASSELLGAEESFECLWGFNTKYTFMEDETVDWGAALQMTWFSSDDSTIKTEGYDLQVAVGPTVDMGEWDLYGGLFYYMMDAEVEVGGSPYGDFQEEDCYGAYIGAGFELMENTDVNVELACTHFSYGIGVNIGWHF